MATTRTRRVLSPTEAYHVSEALREKARGRRADASLARDNSERVATDLEHAADRDDALALAFEEADEVTLSC